MNSTGTKLNLNFSVQVGSLLLLNCTKTRDEASIPLPQGLLNSCKRRLGDDTADLDVDDAADSDSETDPMAEVAEDDDFDWGRLGTATSPGDCSDGEEEDVEEEDEDDADNADADATDVDPEEPVRQLH